MQSTVMTLSLLVVRAILASVTGFTIIQEDIVDRSDTSLVKTQSASTVTELWDSGVIPVFIDDSIKSRDGFYRNVTTALNMVVSMTSGCITFRDMTAADKGYVNITGLGSGCYSDVGYKGKERVLNLGHRCGIIGVIMHEILHTIGLWHEQSRSDRDHYVKIHFYNILRSNWKNFDKINENKYKEMETDVPYDFLSIMHYKYNQFAEDRSEATIEPMARFHVDKESLGQRKNLTDSDIQKILWLYNCAICKKYSDENVVSIPNNNSFSVGSIVNFECQNKAGYSMIGANTRTCGKSGNWVGAVPMCVKSSLLRMSRGMVYDNCEDNLIVDKRDTDKRWSNQPWTASRDGSGPEADHTYGTYLANKTAKGRFYYFNSTDSDNGGNGILRTKLLYNGRRHSNVSVVFFYHMFGNGIGSLSVSLRLFPTWVPKVLWTLEGSRSHRTWYCVHITAQERVSLTLRGYYLVDFQAVSGSNGNMTIAIDDIFIGHSAEVDKFAAKQKCGEQERKDNLLSDYGDPRVKYK